MESQHVAELPPPTRGGAEGPAGQARLHHHQGGGGQDVQRQQEHPPHQDEEPARQRQGVEGGLVRQVGRFTKLLHFFLKKNLL